MKLNLEKIKQNFYSCADTSVCECSYPAGQQQPGAVGCSIVCEAYSDSIFGQLVRIGGAHDVISFDLCIGNLENAQRRTFGQVIFLKLVEIFRACSLTWQQMSLLESLTIIRYLGVLYLFLSCTTRRFRAQKSVLPSVDEKQPTITLKSHTDDVISDRQEQGSAAHAHSAAGVNKWSFTSSSSELHFISLEVRLALHHFDKTLRANHESVCRYASCSHKKGKQALETLGFFQRSIVLTMSVKMNFIKLLNTQLDS